jgi:RNA polymerase sigma-70 factor (ECF subfamily)
MTNPFSSLFAPTDEQAMWRVQHQDDSAAFAHLVRRWETPIQRLCGRMTGDIQRGEDLAQETFARLFAKRKEYQPTGKVSTYMWRIALNLCHDELRRRVRRGETSLDAEQLEPSISALPAYEAAPDTQLVDQERADMVRAALDRLPEGYRAVLVLRHYENLKFREIAEVLDIPEGTVKSRMAEALSQLTRYLKPAMDGPPVSKPDRRIDERMLI